MCCQDGQAGEQLSEPTEHQWRSTGHLYNEVLVDYNQTLNQFRKFVKLHGVRKVKEDIKDLDLNFYDELFGHGMKPIKIVPAILGGTRG